MTEYDIRLGGFVEDRPNQRHFQALDSEKFELYGKLALYEGGGEQPEMLCVELNFPVWGEAKLDKQLGRTYRATYESDEHALRAINQGIDVIQGLLYGSRLRGSYIEPPARFVREFESSLVLPRMLEAI